MNLRTLLRKLIRSLPIARFAIVLLFGGASLAAAADAGGLTGDWKTSDGSVVRVTPCASTLCLRVVTISPTAPGNRDENNPDPALRNRPICNLEIGSGFAPDGNQATNGHIYDPLSGKTYKATLKLDGDTLKLRGYIGISAFGRTERWQRTTVTKSCS